MNKPKQQISVHMAVSIIVGIYVPLVAMQIIWTGWSMILPYIFIGAFFAVPTGLIAIIPVTYAYRLPSLRKNLDGIAGMAAASATVLVNLIVSSLTGMEWLPLTFNIIHLSATVILVAILVNRSLKLHDSKEQEAISV